jgi:beta-N-acetylhexosaminidase
MADKPTAIILGCEKQSLSDWEKSFFRDINPFGFILFARNIADPDQLRGLVAALRDCVGRPQAPVLIDQEGGRVQRLRPPHWRQAPAAARFGVLAARDRTAAERAAWLNGRLLAAEMSDLGINVDCWPCLDLRLPEGHGVIGDRAFGSDPELVAGLGRAGAEGLLAGGVLPVIKHIPGHGRAAVDSHLSLPRVATDRRLLAATDFAPFRALSDLPWAMTAHVVYEAIDSERPATTSPPLIDEVIRGEMGFDGLLLSDDLSMSALSGGLGERAAAALAAGCDIALHCNGNSEEMQAVAAAVGPLSAAASERAARGWETVSQPQSFAREAALAELAELLADSEPLDKA